MDTQPLHVHVLRFYNFGRWISILHPHPYRYLCVWTYALDLTWLANYFKFIWIAYVKWEYANCITKTFSSVPSAPTCQYDARGCDDGLVDFKMEEVNLTVPLPIHVIHPSTWLGSRFYNSMITRIIPTTCIFYQENHPPSKFEPFSELLLSKIYEPFLYIHHSHIF